MTEKNPNQPVEMKHVNAAGEFVSIDSPDAAYQVNPDDTKFVQRLKDAANKDANAESTKPLTSGATGEKTESEKSALAPSQTKPK